MVLSKWLLSIWKKVETFGAGLGSSPEAGIDAIGVDGISTVFFIALLALEVGLRPLCCI